MDQLHVVLAGGFQHAKLAGPQGEICLQELHGIVVEELGLVDSDSAPTTPRKSGAQVGRATAYFEHDWDRHGPRGGIRGHDDVGIRLLIRNGVHEHAGIVQRKGLR